MFIRNLAVSIAVALGLHSVGTAAETAQVIVGPNAPQLERFAARELVSQFENLFEAEVSLATELGKGEVSTILIGSPETNPAVKRIVGDQWPKLSDQGIVLKSYPWNGKSALIVGGGSPVATLWAVYDLGHHFGIRYLTREDIYPNGPIPFELGGIDVVSEPEFRTRTWRTVNDFAVGPESWPLTDHIKLLGQLAKLKFNRVMLSFYPWQPFIHYEFRGVKKTTAMLWFGEQFDIPRDAPGRTALGGATTFTNPDFAGKKTYQEMTDAGIAHARGIIDEAHRLGMSAGISIRPAEFTREFAAALPGAKDVRQLKSLTIGPGANQGPKDPLLRELVATKIRAYLNTYPTIDALYVGMPEFPEWHEHVESAWKDLSGGGELNGLTLKELVETARNRNLIASGDRGESSLKGNIVALSFFKQLFSDENLLKRGDGQAVELVIRSIDPALFPALEKIIPAGASTLNFIDYTARRIVENRQLLGLVSTDKVRSGLILTLADDNVGILSQSVTGSLEKLVSEMQRQDWDGFSTRYWMLAELDPSIYFLSRSSWDREATARSTHDELFSAITGKQATVDRLWLCFQHIEKATQIIDRNDIGFGFPVQGLLMKHYRPQPIPKWWTEVQEHYTQAMIELYRANSNTDPRASRLLFYWAKRGEYVLEYLGAVQAVREAALARQRGDKEKAIEHLEVAVEQLYNAIDTLSDVARDQSDRGLIAVLNAHAYRPLVAEYERLASE